MSLHSCAEAIARIQYQRPQPITEPTKTPRSYRHEEWLGKRFVVLVAPPDVAVVKRTLPSATSGYLDAPPKKKRSWRRRKEESDRNWKGTQPPKVAMPNRERWFLSDEAERIQRRLDEEDAAKLQPRREAMEPRPRKIVHSVFDREDTGPLPIISTKRFRDPAAFVRKQFKQLVQERVAAKNIADMADVLAAQAKGLSVREIAERKGRTTAWVRWQLVGISKLFIRHGIKDLSQRAQQKIDIATC